MASKIALEDGWHDTRYDQWHWSCCRLPCFRLELGLQSSTHAARRYGSQTTAPGCIILQLVLQRLCLEALEPTPSRGLSKQPRRCLGELMGPRHAWATVHKLQINTPYAAAMQVLQPAQRCEINQRAPHRARVA